jgi:ribonuclease HII
MLDLSFEQNYFDQGYTRIVGVDEVGRGPLAGPVVAGAVLVGATTEVIPKINDSKRLSAKLREELTPKIKKTVISWSIQAVSVIEIETIGIVDATFKAMAKAVKHLGSFDIVIVDGNQVPSLDISQTIPIQAVIKGDSKSYAVAAASIIAKVYRDKLMQKLAWHYPQYGWDRNKGYGTKKHIEAINQYGLTIYHRKSFCDHLTLIV